jgi:hypothetical protein
MLDGGTDGGCVYTFLTTPSLGSVVNYEKVNRPYMNSQARNPISEPSAAPIPMTNIFGDLARLERRAPTLNPMNNHPRPASNPNLNASGAFFWRHDSVSRRQQFHQENHCANRPNKQTQDDWDEPESSGSHLRVPLIESICL